jgi:hypothetical protein
MYICNACDCVFEDPKQHKEFHGELDEMPYETFGVCPACASTDFDEAVECSVCGNWILEGNHQFQICSECKEQIQQRFETLLRNKFSPEEILYLNYKYDGEHFGGYNVKREVSGNI